MMTRLMNKLRFFIPFSLFILGFWIFSPLIFAIASFLMSSVEPTVWVRSRFILENFPNLSWFPYWYLGYPFRFSGPPIFPYGLAILDKVTSIDFPTLDLLISGLALVLTPVGWFFFSLKLFGVSRSSSRSLSNATSILRPANRRGSDTRVRQLADSSRDNSLKDKRLQILTSLMVALWLLVIPSFGYLFPQAQELGQKFGFFSWSAVSFLAYGGGARILAIAILPWSLLCFWQAIGDWNRKNLIFAAALSALLFLTDGVTSLVFLVGVISLILACGLVEDVWPKVGRGLVIIILAFGLVAFWYTPSYLLHLASTPSISGMGLGAFVGQLIKIGVVAIPVFLAIGSVKIKKTKENIPLFFAIFWLSIFLFLTLLYYFSDPDFLTEYSRFFGEIDIGLAILIGFFLLKFRKVNALLPVGVAILLIVGILSTFWHRLPKIEYQKTVEADIANWLSQNTVGERVYLSGSTAFWLNWFFPQVQQVRGGVDEASTNPFWAAASYQIREGEKGLMTALWLQALRTPYIVVHDKDSKEAYHDFSHPDKFGEFFTKKFDNQKGDQIFETSNAEMARIVKKSSFAGLKGLKDGADYYGLNEYVVWLDYDRSRTPAVSWQSSSEVEVKVKGLKDDEGISLGITWDSGWNVKCQTHSTKCQVEIKKDPVGNIFIDPKVNGDVEIFLKHSPRIDNWLGYAISLLTVLILLFWSRTAPKLAKIVPRWIVEDENDN